MANYVVASDTGGPAGATLDPHDASDDCELVLGVDDALRGKCVIQQDSGDPANPRSGVLVLGAEDGTTHAWFWLAKWASGVGGDDQYYLWARRTDPGVAENNGVRIGGPLTA